MDRPPHANGRLRINHDMPRAETPWTGRHTPTAVCASTTTCLAPRCHGQAATRQRPSAHQPRHASRRDAMDRPPHANGRLRINHDTPRAEMPWTGRHTPTAVCASTTTCLAPRRHGQAATRQRPSAHQPRHASRRDAMDRPPHANGRLRINHDMPRAETPSTGRHTPTAVCASTTTCRPRVSRFYIA